MNNFDIAKEIAEDAEVFSFARRAAPIFEVRRIMALKGLKNIDLAERLGVSEANISRWLRGDQNLKLDTLYSISDAVQERLDLRFGESEAKQYVSTMKYSEPELSTFFVSVHSVDQNQSYHKGDFVSCNDEEYGLTFEEVEINESCIAFG
jgi:transcriptional regulator with XRE-family HTH domain